LLQCCKCCKCYRCCGVTSRPVYVIFGRQGLAPCNSTCLFAIVEIGTFENRKQEEYPSARQKVRENLSEYSFVWVLDPAPRQELEPPAWGRLREIAVPTLIVVGGDDSFLLHRYADQLERNIAAVKRVTIPGTHHMPNMEKPEEFNHIVLDFLKSL
jgi:pimeloyl-ACP methyl ester carboxylesterase